MFLPVVSTGAAVLGDLVDGLRAVFSSPMGQWFLRMAAGLATGLIAVTAFAGVIWGIGAGFPYLIKGIATLKTALFGMGWPFWALVAVGTLLYLAWKNNFGGMADTLTRWGTKISLVTRGVTAVFNSLKGGVGEIQGKLAEDIEAAGVVGLVTTAGKILYRLQAVFEGFWDVISAVGKEVHALLAPAFTTAAVAAGWLKDVIFGASDGLGQTAAATKVATWKEFGRQLAYGVTILGMIFAGVKVVGVVMAIAAVAVKAWAVAQALLNATFLGCPLLWLVAGIAAVAVGAYLLVKNWDAIKTWWSGLWSSIVNTITATWEGIKAWWFGLLDSITGAFIAKFESVKAWWGGLWGSITGTITGIGDVLSGINLFESGSRIINTLIDGIKAKAGEMVESVKGVFSKVREYLPFSDAKTGPFSDLTTSGGAIMSTLGQGVMNNAGGFIDSISGVFGQASGLFGLDGMMDGDFALAAPAPALAQALPPPPATTEGRGAAARQTEKGGGIVIQKLEVTLPSVKDGQGFADELKNFLEQYDA